MKIKKIRADAKWFCDFIEKTTDLSSKKSSSLRRSPNQKKKLLENEAFSFFPFFVFWVFSFLF